MFSFSLHSNPTDIKVCFSSTTNNQQSGKKPISNVDHRYLLTPPGSKDFQQFNSWLSRPFIEVGTLSY
jgi:hypothetical protein